MGRTDSLPDDRRAGHRCSHRLRFNAKEDLLAQLLALNQQVAAKIEKGEPVMPPGVPKNYPDAKKLVTEDCIKPAA